MIGHKIDKVNRLIKLRSQMRTCVTPALNSLDKRLEKYLDFDEGTFIEVGGNDGYTQSNTYYYETCRKWKGILIEAIPELAEICRITRPDAMVFHCALVANSYTKPNVRMQYADLMSLVDGAYGTDLDEQKRIQDVIDKGWIKNTYSVEVTARTLTSVIEESGLTKIDFFSLDVEGYELQVLSGLDFSKLCPRFILVETLHPKKIAEALPDKYRLLEQITKKDFLFKLST